MRRYIGGVHRLSRATSRWIRASLNSAVEDEAHRLLGQIPRPTLRIDEETGYAVFTGDDLGITPALTKIAELAHEWRSDPSRPGVTATRLTSISKPEDLLNVPELMDLALHPEIYGAAAHYLGQAPALIGVEVWFTPRNKTAAHAQLFHFDHRDARQAKIFISLNDIDEDTGPLYFLDAADSAKVSRALGHSQGRYEDDEVYGVVPRDRLKSTIGPRNTGFIVDTARCLHYGSRGNDKERLVFTVNYARPNCESPERHMLSLDLVRDQLIATRYKDDPARAFSLRKFN